MSYGMSLLDLDLTGGKMTVTDEFTPFNEANLDGEDGDLGAGGPVLLPAQTLASGATLNPLVEIGKSGMFYILDRNNLGGFTATTDQVVQEVQTPISGGFNWGAGVWGTEAYWNGNIYSGGTDPGATTYRGGTGNSFTAHSFQKGLLSTAPTSESVEQYSYPGPTHSVSASGTTNGIVWVVKTDSIGSLGPEALTGGGGLGYRRSSQQCGRRIRPVRELQRGSKHDRFVCKWHSYDGPDSESIIIGHRSS